MFFEVYKPVKYKSEFSENSRDVLTTKKPFTGEETNTATLQRKIMLSPCIKVCWLHWVKVSFMFVIKLCTVSAGFVIASVFSQLLI